MTNALVVVVIVLANVGLAAVTLGSVIQRSERSLYRYRMWQLRDEVVDAVRDRTVDPHPVVREWINRTESMIRVTDALTPFRFLQASFVLRRAGVDLASHELEGPDEVIAFLNGKTECAREARTRLFLYGSPSGWAVLPAVGLVAVSRQMQEKRLGRQKSAQATVRVWSNQKFGSTSEVFSPLVEKQKPATREPAYT